jgi:hypothetical protein
MYTCDKCKGTSTDSKFCENPACPLMPCCMQVEEMCACDIESSFTLHWIPKYSIKYSSVFNKRYYEVLFEDQEITVLHCYASLSQN